MLEVLNYGDVTAFKGTVSYRTVKLQVYNYLVDGMLIDTSTIQLLHDLKSAYGKHEIDLVSITHAHEDHTGTAKWIEDNLNIPIYIHPESIEDCQKEADYPRYRQLVWGRREAFSPKALPDTLYSRNDKWDVIYTPGHAIDHMAFYNEEKGMLFSGDLFVTPKPKVIMQNESIPTLMHSLEKVLQYDFDKMYCCHAGIVQKGKEMLKFKLEYLQDIKEKVVSLDQEGKSREEIQQQLFPNTPPIVPFSNYDWDSKHIINSIIDHS